MNIAICVLTVKALVPIRSEKLSNDKKRPNSEMGDYLETADSVLDARRRQF